MAPWILGFIPEHKTYVEPFGGSAAVMLAKGKSRYEVEIYNDIWGLVVNFFRVLQASPEELLRKLQVMPYSRALHHYFHDELKQLSPSDIRALCSKPSIDMAARFFYLNYTSVGSDVYGGFSTSPDYRAAERYQHHVDHIQKISTRFKEVIIESIPEGDLFSIYERPDTFWYIDPPYDLPQMKVNNLYGGLEWAQEDHERLATQIKNLNSKWALSYYDTPLIRRLYPQTEFEWNYYASAKHWNRKDAGSASKKPASEVLILNYKVNAV